MLCCSQLFLGYHIEILNYSTEILTTVAGLRIMCPFICLSAVFGGKRVLYKMLHPWLHWLEPDPAHVSSGSCGFGLHICKEPVKLLPVFVAVLPSADW